jgi:hypothetical protein
MPSGIANVGVFPLSTSSDGSPTCVGAVNLEVD